MRRFVIILLAAVSLAGCPVSKDPYTASMQASLSVSDAVSQAIPIVQQLRDADLITSAEAHLVFSYLQSATTGNQVFRSAVKSLHASGNNTAAAYIAAADTFVKGINSTEVLGQIHISNPASQNKVMLYLRAVDTVLNGIETAIQNNSIKPTPAPVPVTGALVWTQSLLQI